MIAKLSESEGDKIEMVFESSGKAEEEAVCRAHVRPACNFEQHARQAGQMLLKLLEGDMPEMRHELVPMEIVELSAV